MTENDKAARAEQLAALETRTEEEQAELDALVDELTAPEPEPSAPPTEAQGVTPPEDKPSRRRSRRKVDESEDVDKAPAEKRYCAYDLTHGRFIGAPGTKADAEQVVEHNATDHELEIREV